VYCLGVDEAGYGPRLGPLVISASLWELPTGLAPDQMYQRLCRAITTKSSGRTLSSRSSPPGATPPNQVSRSVRSARPLPHPTDTQRPVDFPPLVLADSKLVYTRLGRAGLERTVLAMLAGAGKRPTDWAELVEAVALDSESRQSALAWYPAYWPQVPESLSAEEIAQLAPWVARAMAEQGIRLLGLRSVLVFPERFNRLVHQYGNKATMLSCESLELVRRILGELPAGPVQVLCDKHGGRDRYEHLISETFAASFFQPAQVNPIQQSRQESIYQLQTANGPVEFRFLCGGEAMMPVALASMLSKYLRELAMEAWNRFWAEQTPGIQPTAGYPLDARRFRAEIAARQTELGIPDSAIWRCR